MTILVTGANGQLGNEIRLVSAGSKDKYIFADILDQKGVETLKLDITDLDAVRAVVKKYGVNVIVNCAAYNNVDKAEDDKDACEQLNVKAPEYLAVAMKEANGLLVHFSSDYVFGGESHSKPLTESKPATPSGTYALSKLNGEKAVQSVGGKHIIIRTAWLYSEFGKNFCKTMMELTATKPQLKVVFDQVGTPTYARDLANAIVVILADYAASHPKHSEGSHYTKSGIYHYSNEGVCSWYDFTKMIAEYSGNVDCYVEPCHSDEYPSKVVRPSYSVLDKTKIKSVFGVEVPYWIDSLKKCIANLKKFENEA